MDRIAVSSSTIRTVGYDDQLALLRVEFQNGAIYDYADVPASIHAELLGATSKGAYFDRYIRGRYPCRQRSS